MSSSPLHVVAVGMQYRGTPLHRGENYTLVTTPNDHDVTGYAVSVLDETRKHVAVIKVSDAEKLRHQGTFTARCVKITGRVVSFTDDGEPIRSAALLQILPETSEGCSRSGGSKSQEEKEDR